MWTAIHMPAMKNLRTAAPYYTPYLIPFTVGLLIVLASSAITSVIPWFLRRAIDAIGAGAPMRTIWQLAGLIVLAAIVGGAFRYGMRELMNGVSRWMEYDLRNDLFTHLETLDPAYFAQTRTGDIMARLTNDLGAVRMALGPAVMYLTNTIFGGLFALYFMLRIDVRLTLLALLPTIFLPVLTIKMGKAIHDRFEAVQEHFSTLTTQAQENLTGARIVRAIEFRNVGFHYRSDVPGEPRWVLRNVSFKVPAGATLGVVGATGSGKSALIELIPRMYDPQEGEILIDGVPTRNVAPAELREEIGFVPQESLLFSETIGSNLSYGTNGLTQTGEWAANVAQLDQTIGDFPGRYETILGERGINLSGGHKQRASLVRALARKPSIVLLDDALSAVDTHTEAEILRALREALSTRTALIASHRISAIRDASWIIVLEKGMVVEQGRHAELMAARGRYWSLLRRQQLLDAVESDTLATDVTAGTI